VEDRAEGFDEVDLWMLDRPSKDDSHRPQWPFTPFVHVGPLSFGMTHDDVVNAMGGADHRELRDHGGACHLEFAANGVNAYFDVQVGLACVAVDAFTGPQVLAPGGFALVGRPPSQVKPWFTGQLDAFDTYCVVNEYMDAGIEELGLIMRTQHGGDINLTRPVFVARAWVDMFMHTEEGRIPVMEWRNV
jgi:hypothetical protein